MNDKMQSVGKKRNAATKLNITSKNIFYSDIQDDDALFAMIIRSPIKKGTIREISHPNLPDGYKIITAKDIPGKNEIIANNVVKPILAWERVSFFGEPIGLIVGKNPSDIIEVSKELVIKTSSSTEQDAKTEPEIIASRQINFGESELMYTNSAIQFEKDYVSKLHVSKSQECLGAFCTYSKKQFQIFAPTKWASQLIFTTANCLNVDTSNVAVVKTITKTTVTNNIFSENVIAVMAAIACKVTEKPIKLMLFRFEHDEFIDKPIEVHTKFNFSIEEGGIIRAMNASIKIDVGDCCPIAQKIVDRIVIALVGIYKFKNYSITGYAYKSNQFPLAFDLQLTDFQAFFSMENILQDISQQLHISPIEIRKINLITNDKNSPYPFKMNSNSLNQTIDAVVKNSDFYRKYTSYTLATKIMDKNFPLKGIGLSCAFEGSGFYDEMLKDDNTSMEVSIEKSGEVLIKSNKASSNVEKNWKNVASQILGIEQSKIKVIEITENANSIVTTNPKIDTVSILTNLLRKCCTQLKKEFLKQPLPLSVKRQVSKIKNTKWNSKEFCGNPFFDTSWISVVTEIEIDRNTFVQNILAIWIVIDAGEIFNRESAISSILKSIKTVLKMCLPNQNFANIPINIEFIDSNKDSKEIGNLIYNALPSSLANALSVALRKDVSVFPLSMDAIYYSFEV